MKHSHSHFLITMIAVVSVAICWISAQCVVHVEEGYKALQEDYRRKVSVLESMEKTKVGKLELEDVAISDAVRRLGETMQSINLNYIVREFRQMDPNDPFYNPDLHYDGKSRLVSIRFAGGSLADALDTICNNAQHSWSIELESSPSRNAVLIITPRQHGAEKGTSGKGGRE